MSKALPWFRAYTEMVDDEKLKLLAFEDRWHYVALLCIKGQGLLDKDEEPALMLRKVAVKLGLDMRTLDEVVRRLADVGLIERETLQPLKWDARQMRSDCDMTAADRKRRQRERERGGNGVTDESRVTGTDVTRTDTDTDTDTEEEREINTSRAIDGAEIFEQAWLAYPRRAGGNSKTDARKAFAARVKSGVDPREMLAGVQRYAAFCVADRKVGTAYVKQAATFFGPGEHWTEQWAVQAQAGGAGRGPGSHKHAGAHAAIFEGVDQL